MLGDPVYGRLGTGDAPVTPETPTQVEGLTGATALVAGDNHTCALMPGGTAKCWGINAAGQLGDGTRDSRSVPVAVSGLSGATALTAGGQHSCALMPGGTAKCWGINATGQLGDGTRDSRSVPVAVSGLSGATALTAGGQHSCALMPGGTAKCWGDNNSGQLGDGSTTSRLRPSPVQGLSGASELTSTSTHTCALISNGTAKCWGDNNSGQLGDGSFTNRSLPTPVVGLGGVPVPDPEPEPEHCASTYFVAIRGSGEEPKDKSLENYESSPGEPAYVKSSGMNADTKGMGDTIAAVFREFHEQLDRHQNGPNAPGPVQARALTYPAIPVNLADLSYRDRYQRSVKVGASQLGRQLRAISASCNNARVVIAGYSQGADVINKSMGEAQRTNDQALFSQVKKIVVLGDPSHLPNRAENVGDWWKLGSTNGSGASVAAVITDLDSYKFKDANPGKVASLCLIGDLVCDTSSADVSEAIAGAVGPQTHNLYAGLSMQCPVVNNAWQYPTDCGAHILTSGLGFTPVPRDRGGLHADQIIAQSGKSVWATAVAIKAPVAGAIGQITKLSVTLRSDPIDVGTFDVNEDGIAIINFVVPDVPIGLHHLELTGDDGRTYVIPMYITAEPTDSAPVFFVIDGSRPTTTPGPETPTSSGSSGSLQLPFGS